MLRGDVLRRRRGRALLTVALTEFLDTPGRIDDLLFSGIERMTRRANFDMQRLVDRRARFERDAAAARHVDFGVFGVNVGFHFSRLSIGPGCRDDLAPESPFAEIIHPA